MLKSEEMLSKITNKINECKSLEGQAKADLFEEIKNLKADYEIQKQLEEDEINQIENKITDKKEGIEKMENKKVNVLRAIIKDMTGKALNEHEREAVKNAIVGEEYILPSDVSTKIRELIREAKSLRDVVGYMPVPALTGSFPIENFEDVAELIDFEDGEEIEEANDMSFRQVKFALKQKGAIIPLSNTLLEFTDNDLTSYVARIFARKAIKTYNNMIIATLKAGKTVKPLTDVKALVKSIRTNLDPACAVNAVVVTNQNGYEKLAAKVDGNQVAYLQADLSQPAQLHVNGKLVHVISNAQLPDATGDVSPVFYGDLANAIKFVDAGKYAFAIDKSAGFTRNLTLTRVIDYVDCIKVDGSDKVYCVGELA